MFQSKLIIDLANKIVCEDEDYECMKGRHIISMIRYHIDANYYPNIQKQIDFYNEIMNY